MIIDQLPALVTAGNNDEIAIEVGTTTYKIKKSDFLKEFMPKSGGEFTGDVTVGGVLNVTPRRCYATLSSPGWYRVCTCTFINAAWARGATGLVAKFDISRTGFNTTAESHSITFRSRNSANGKFMDEESLSTTLLIDKIRFSCNNNIAYVDIHYTGSTSDIVSIYFVTYLEPQYQTVITANQLESVEDSSSVETVLTEYSFAEADGDITSQITFSNATLAQAKRSGNIINISYQGNSIAHQQSEVLATLPSGLQPSRIHWCIGYINGVPAVVRINYGVIDLWTAPSYPSGRLYFEATYIL